MSINKCIFTQYTNNCKFCYIFTQIGLSQYRVIKKEKKRIRKRLSPLIVTSYKKYVRVKIEEYDPINDTLLENKKRFIIINDDDLQSYMNTLKIETNDYYNRNIGLIPNLI